MEVPRKEDHENRERRRKKQIKHSACNANKMGDSKQTQIELNKTQIKKSSNRSNQTNGNSENFLHESLL